MLAESSHLNLLFKPQHPGSRRSGLGPDSLRVGVLASPRSPTLSNSTELAGSNFALAALFRSLS